MKQALLFVALFFAAHSVLGQTNTAPAAADTDTQQQVDPQPVYQQPHDAPPIPPAIPTPPAAVTQARTGKASVSEHWQYDPAARAGGGNQNPSNESVIERGLKGINPCNVNYGGLLAAWRLAAVKETIENINFWALLFLCGSLTLATAYIAWLLHEREDRLQITGAIIAQLWNAHMFARGKALEAIEAHNKLVAEIDAEDAAAEEQSAQPAATPAFGMAASITPDAPGASARSATNVRDDSARAWAESVFEDPPKNSNPVSKDVTTPNVHAGQDDANEAAPLALRAARWQETRQEQPLASAPIPEVATNAGEPPEVLLESEKDTAPSDAEDVDAIKLALQKATETLTVQAAQIATKDAQLRAKDDKITSQRQLVSDLNNKLKANSATGSGAS